MVRDLARSLGKEAQLNIVGEDTLVDRDILAQHRSPLNHLLRNAVDHGIETPEQRAGRRQAADGRHRAGGAPQRRHAAVSRSATTAAASTRSSIRAQRGRAQAWPARRWRRALSEAELLEFLFLPGFSMKDTVTEISGRGVGLDVVQQTSSSRTARCASSPSPGAGFAHPDQLPLTLSVVRALLVEIERRALRVPARQGRAGAQGGARTQHPDAGGQAVLRARRRAPRPGVGAPGAGTGRSRRQPATNCRWS